MEGSSPDFELEREIGAGATGRVWRARAQAGFAGLAQGEALAVKFLRPELRSDERARRAFEREARATIAVHHPSLAHGLARGENGRGPWYAMRLVPGPTLREHLELRGVLPEEELRPLALALAEALTALHEAGFAHGDLKPENVRLDAAGRPVLLDLGFARELDAAPELADEARAGSLLYLSPEQARGARGDAASEVFSLGLLLYELATGEHPFVAARTQDASEVLRAMREGRFVPPSRIAPALSPFLDELLADLLALEPARRPSASELARRLREGEAGSWWREEIRSSARAAQRARGQHPWIPLVGRERELEALRKHWERAARGGGVAWLWGEVGSGKSRLVDEFVRELRRGEEPPLFLAARCPEFEEERPAEPILQLLAQFLALPRGRAVGERERALLAQLVPPADLRVLASALDPGSEPASASAVPVALAHWLGALGRGRPTIVFLDDLNWAGAGTLDVLERAVDEGLGDSRMLLLFGLREELARRWPHSLDRLRRRAGAAGAELDLELGPIGLAAVLQLVEACFSPDTPRRSLARQLWEKSHGNPGFLVEILRGLLARGDALAVESAPGLYTLRIPPERIPWPRSLTGAIHQSFGELPAGERRWLARMAVAGARIQPDFLLRTWPGESRAAIEDLLARLVDSGWLVRNGDRYRFAWPALRENVYRTLRAEQRRRMHAAVADALLPEVGASISRSDAFQRAFHLRAAGHSAELLAWIERLLPRMQERGQPQRLQALAGWGLEAVETLPTSPERERITTLLLEAAADAADRLGHRERQRVYLDRLSELDLDPERDPEWAGRVYLLHARYAISVGQYGSARSMLRNAVQWFELAGNAALESDALRRLAAVQAHVGELEDARALARRARERAGGPLLRARSEITLGVIDVLTDELESALRQADRAIRALADSDSALADGTRAAAHLLRARTYRSGGRPRRALASAQRALRLARMAGEERLATEALARLGAHLLDVDRVAEAEERLREALRQALEIEDRRNEAIAALFLGILLAEREGDEADQLLARALEIAREIHMARLEAVALAVHARRRRRAGELEQAHAASERALELLEHYGAELLDRAVIVGSHAVVLHELGRTAEADGLVRELRRHLRRENQRIHSPLLRRRHRMATTRLLQAVLSTQGSVYPRVRLEHLEEPAPDAD